MAEPRLTSGGEAATVNFKTFVQSLVEMDIKGLTSAAALWMTAALGVACGGDEIGVALISAVLTVIVLAYAGMLERRAEKKG